MVQIYDRKKKSFYIEDEYGKKMIDFLYKTPLGRFILKTTLINPVVSKIYAIYEKSAFSKKKIKPFIVKNSINMKEYEKKRYKSFDEFFTRKKKQSCINISKDTKALISPCDAKLQVFKIDNKLKVKIKGVEYKIPELLQDKKLAEKYKNGLCLVYRLAVDDYHRYCYIDSGKPILRRGIKGKLHTVREIAQREKVFRENQREYTVLDTKNLGEMIQMEVGAILIGKINNYSMYKFKRGQEKGYFSYGGSTIVVFLRENVAKIDDDILDINKKDIEVQVKYGEKVGEIIC